MCREWHLLPDSIRYMKWDGNIFINVKGERTTNVVELESYKRRKISHNTLFTIVHILRDPIFLF